MTRTRRSTTSKKEIPATPLLSAAQTDSATMRSICQEKQEEQPFLTVGIGASAGGLAALEAFFSAISEENGANMAFVVVQHLAPNHKSLLVEIIGRCTPLPVQAIQDGMDIAAGNVYIIPPNRDLILEGGKLRLSKPVAQRNLRLPIDLFFRSLALNQRYRAVAIVFSGSGTDGTLGVRTVKAEGGLVLVQNPESAEHGGMPKSVIATGLADAVLPPAEMPAQLTTYAAHAHCFPEYDKGLTQDQALRGILQHVCLLLREQTGNDFSLYKGNTLCRRIERRMALHQIDHPAHYLRYLRENKSEVESLFHDLLIGVTSFFRDQEAFEALRTQAIPRLFASTPDGGTIRVWVCGCATGEEAYSLAMLFIEELEAQKRTCKVQIFATDIDPKAIQHARTGVFPASIVADVSEERLSRFFIREPASGAYRVQKAVRELLVFSMQDVTRDPPFSRVNLLSSRNLLIYMTTDLQKRIIPLFHYALKTDGVLFLGNSESIGEFSALFTPLDPRYKLFIRKANASDIPRPTLGDFLGNTATGTNRPRLSRVKGETNFRVLTEQSIIAHYAQSAVLVDGRGKVLYIHGRTGRYLEPAPGEAAMDIMAMAREGLSRELSMALHKAMHQKETVCCEAVKIQTDRDFIFANLIVRPIPAEQGSTTPRDLFLIMFEEVESPPEGTKAGPVLALAETDRLIAGLEQELVAKEEYLQTTIEEMRSSNEDLRTANEALQSANEELQSANEELETSREELQSVNEELATVNAELQNKVAELSRANNDMNNLLAGTGVGTLFVDMQLRVSRFTPTITQVINLIRTDIGRPLAHIMPNLVNYDRMVEDVREVLEDLLPREAEVRTRMGTWFLMRIRPYRTLDNVIEGAVLTFVDITEHRRVREALREQAAQIQHAQILVRDMESRVVTWTKGMEELYGFTAGEAVGRLSYEVLNTVFPEPLQEIETEVLRTGRWQGELTHTARDGRHIVISSAWTLYRDEDGTPRHIIEANNIITQHHKQSGTDKKIDINT